MKSLVTFITEAKNDFSEEERIIIRQAACFIFYGYRTFRITKFLKYLKTDCSHEYGQNIPKICTETRIKGIATAKDQKQPLTNEEIITACMMVNYIHRTEAAHDFPEYVKDNAHNNGDLVRICSMDNVRKLENKLVNMLDRGELYDLL